MAAEVEEAVEAVMEEIDGHELAGSSVPRSVSMRFYREIVAACKLRMAAMEEDDDADDESDDG